MKRRVAAQSATGGVERGSTVRGTPSERQSEQYSLAKILGIWAAAALPMGILGWTVYMEEQPRPLIVNIVDDCARCGGGRVAER